MCIAFVGMVLFVLFMDRRCLMKFLVKGRVKAKQWLQQ